MGNPPQPPAAEPQKDSVEFRKFAGIKNTVERERLGPDELEIAINVDLDDVGELHRRQGSQLVASGNWSSLFNSDLGKVYGVRNGVLGRVLPNFNFLEMQAGFTAFDPLATVQVGSNIYWSCRTQAGVIDVQNDTSGPWLGPSIPPPYIPDPLDPNALPLPSLPMGTWWWSPVVNPQPTLPAVRGKILGPPPFASALAYFNGRIWLAQGKTLWHTELYLYNYVNMTRNFMQFEHEITMLGSVTDGVYVGTKEGVWFLSHGTRIEGHPPGAFKRIRVMDSGVISGSMVYIPGELGNPPQIGLDSDTPTKVSIMFMTTAGYCVAQDGGQATNFSESKFIFPDAISASAMYRWQVGTHQYIANLNHGGSPSSNVRIGDYADVILRPAGTWQEGSDQIGFTENLSATYIP